MTNVIGSNTYRSKIEKEHAIHQNSVNLTLLCDGKCHSKHGQGWIK